MKTSVGLKKRELEFARQVMALIMENYIHIIMLLSDIQIICRKDLFTQ